MSLGAIACEQMYLDALIERARSQRFDLSTALDTQLLLYDPVRIMVIDRIDVVYVTENPAAASTINIGIPTSTAAIVSGFASAASGTKGDVGHMVLATTLASKRNDRTAGKPIIPVGVPVVFSNTASGGAGEIVVIVCAYPIDTMQQR